MKDFHWIESEGAVGANLKGAAAVLACPSSRTHANRREDLTVSQCASEQEVCG